MFELSVALKYLRPRWRQLSVSIISLISVLVIALVVWLIVVFFSVTNGLEKNWVQKLISLTAPIRITPTNHYYKSYYYQIDSISNNSDYTLKSIAEKKETLESNPYDEGMDEEVPKDWPSPDLTPEGKLLDPVKTAYSILEKDFPFLKVSDYEATGAQIKLRLIRETANGSLTQAFINQPALIGTLDSNNPTLINSLLPFNASDYNNILKTIPFSSILEENEGLETLPSHLTKKILNDYFQQVLVSQLFIPKGGTIPKSLLPINVKFSCIALYENQVLKEIWLPTETKEIETLFFELQRKGISLEKNTLLVEDSFIRLKDKEEPIFPLIPIKTSGISLKAQLDNESLQEANLPKSVYFNVSGTLQSYSLTEKIPLGKMLIGQAARSPIHTPSAFWINQLQDKLELPKADYRGDGILLPKAFKDVGVLIGDIGYISYYVPTLSNVQEQRAPIYVAGFYDPGIIPVGGKFIIANRTLTSLIRSAHSQDNNSNSNGINIRFDNLDQAPEIKNALSKAFKEAGIEDYWKIATFREFDYAKDLLQQLQSDKSLFMIIAAVIILVACSNIISLLVILVNDKKIEIGILRSLGASSYSITCIFGICGIALGVTGSALGTIAAALTLKNLDILIWALSFIQGQGAFNPVYYGNALPNQISSEAIIFVIAATAVTSLIAGVVPAVKACLMKPSAVLKSE